MKTFSTDAFNMGSSPLGVWAFAALVSRMKTIEVRRSGQQTALNDNGPRYGMLGSFEIDSNGEDERSVTGQVVFQKDEYPALFSEMQ